MQLGNRVSQHSQALVPSVNSARSTFDRSSIVKDTFDFDYLIPFFCDEVLPGDTMNLNVNAFARLATQKVPIMDNMYVDFFFFFVPNRLVWTNWERFNGAQDDPGDSTDFTIPQIEINTGSGVAVGTIYDKFGIPTGVDDIEINALVPRSYNLIWNEWFRDQNLQDSVLVNKDDGPDDVTDCVLLKRNKRHDYFTSCLPDPQKGPNVTLPLGTYAPVVTNGLLTLQGTSSLNTGNLEAATTAALSDVQARTVASNWIAGENLTYASGLRTDLTNATAATINQLREAFAVQSLYELDARGGTRYVEILLAHWNVQSPDFRLQRPEYLGGGSSKINAIPVPQTAPTSGSNAQAQLAAYGLMNAQNSGIGFSKAFVEHGHVIGLVCARADITYQQGLNKMWTRQTRFDYFWPKLQELGEQAVLQQEILADGTAADLGVFGYQERYAEYRYKPSEIHGEFRSTYSTPLDMWHLAEEFDPMAPPELNSDFIEQNTPIDRAIAVTGAPHLLFDAWCNLKHTRAMVTYSVPSRLGKF